MTPVVLTDLSPYHPADPAEDAWLRRLAARLRPADHVARIAGAPWDDRPAPLLTRGPDGAWWAGRYIGELRFEGRDLRIEPRLGIDIVGAWLAHALDLQFVPKAATDAGNGPLIVQLVDRVWSAALADAARHGAPRLRAVRRHDGLALRGRLDARETARHRLARRPLVTTVRTERDLANPVARALVLADRTLRTLLPTPPTWRPERSTDVLAQLRGAVGARPDLPTDAEVARVRYSPLTRRYAPVARWSLEIARNRGRLTSAGGDDTTGVLLDVAELWELYLVHCARHAFGPARVVHGTTAASDGFLLASTSSPTARLGRLKPDIVLLDADGSPAAIVDAKYKRLRSWAGSPSGVDRGDLYQLASYLSGHDVAVGALAYPPHDTDEAPAVTHGPWTTQAGQRVEFVRIPARRDEGARALTDLLT